VIGVYALLSFSVTARTRELAVRSALGASRLQLLRTVLTRATLPLAIGAALGPIVSAALVAVRGISSSGFPLRLAPCRSWACAVLWCWPLWPRPGYRSRRALRISIFEALKADA
jgi:predicted lysophospholipase L1 biosynthesis ABC-type transport system permease subunit